MKLDGYIHSEFGGRVHVVRIETRGVWFVHEVHDLPGWFAVTHEPSGARVAAFQGGEPAMRKALGFMRALPDNLGASMGWGGVGVSAADYLAIKRAYKAASAEFVPDEPPRLSSRSVRDELRLATRGVQ